MIAVFSLHCNTPPHHRVSGTQRALYKLCKYASQLAHRNAPTKETSFIRQHLAHWTLRLHTFLAVGAAFCHVNGSRWGNPPSRDRVHVTFASAPQRAKMNSSKVTVIKSHSTEMLQQEQIMRGKEHWPPKCVVRPPFSLFTCLATTQQRDPGVVSLHVNAGQFSTTARRVTSPTWGPPPPGKQALNFFAEPL